MRRLSVLLLSATLAACGSAPEALSPPPSKGSIQLGVSGLPAGTLASVSVTGPGAFSRTLTGAATLDDLAPGAYTLAAQAVTAGSTTYLPTPASQVVQVQASDTPVAATVAYASGPQPGRLAVLVSGLPGGTNASVTVTGPAGFIQALTASDTLEGVTAGTYTVAASSVSGGGFTYAGTPASQQVTVGAGALATATLAYAPQGGRLAVLVTGLPGGSNASVAVTGPAGFSRSLTASDTLDAVAAGSYTITAAGVTAGATNYAPTPASQVVSVAAGALASASVSYAVATPSTLNLVMLRVFVRANQANTAAPAVRVRLYQGTNPTPVQTYTIPAPRAAVPLAVIQDTLNASWNQLIPGSVLVPGLRILADVDPGNAVAEANEGDNSFPATGASRAMDVRSVSTMSGRSPPTSAAAPTPRPPCCRSSRAMATTRGASS
ncbi:MAG: hypothetical protein MUC69_05190 [Gemmatimonadales bacterium]|nr:hypothetical protein [Gemmatimonadales bacterium]